MKKKYLYNGQLMELADIQDAAKQSNIDVNAYIQKAGIREVEDNYSFNGKTFSAKDILDAANQSNLGFDDYIQKAGFSIGEKKNLSESGTPTESKPLSTQSVPTTLQSGLAENTNEFNPLKDIVSIQTTPTIIDTDLQNVLSTSKRKVVINATMDMDGGTPESSYTKPFSHFNPDDDKSYETLIDELRTSDSVIGKDGKEVMGIPEIINKLQQRKLLLISKRGLTPIERKAYPDFDDKENEDYFKTKIEDATGRFLSTSKISSDPAKAISVEQITAENLRYGLEDLKTSNPGKYNNVLESLKEKGKIAEPDFEQIAEIGQVIRNQKVITDNEGNTNSNDELSGIKYLGNSYESKKAIAAGKMGEWLKKNGGQNQSEFTEDQMRKAAKATGLNNEEIIKDLIFTEKLVGVDAIPKSGVLPSLFDRGVFMPINNIVNTLAGVGESQSETYLRTNSLGNENIGINKVINSKGQAVDKLESDKDNIFYGAIEGLGQFATQVALTFGIGGGIRAGAGTISKGLIGEGATAALVSSSEAARAAMLTGTFASTYLQEYGQSYEDALNKTGSVSTAKKIGALDATAAAGFELWLPDAQIASNALGAFKKAGFATTLLDIIKKGGDPNELLKKGTNAFVKFAGTTGNVMLQEVAEEIGTTITQHGIEMGFSPQTAKNVDLVNEIVETAKATTIQTLLPAIFGGAGAALQRDFTQKSLHDAALNVEQYKRGFDDLLANEKMSQDEYNKSVSLIQTHRNSIQNSPDVDANGNRISREKRLEYATQQTSIKINNKKLENTELSAPEISDLNRKIKEAEEAQEIIFNPKNKTEVVPEPILEEMVTVNEPVITEQISLIPIVDGIAQILTTEEQTVIDGFKGIEFKGSTKNWTDVLKSETSTPQEKKQALTELKEQLSDHNSEIATGEALGKSADLIYGLIDADKKNAPIISVSDSQILPTFEKVKQVVPEENLVATNDILTRVNNAESINVNEIETAQNELYSALEAAPEAAHLIEPLILKLQDYEFTTKTEVSTVTEERTVEVARPVIERKAVNKSISQWEGNRATITDTNGKAVEGVINLQDGKYYLTNENGEKVAVLGETAITDRDITLPSIEQVPTPIQFDEKGDIKSMTLQLNKLDKENGGIVPDKLITINFRDKEKALDYAIQLRAEQVGEFPQPEFDVIYEQVQREIKTEVPITQTQPIQNEQAINQQANTENKQSNVQTVAAQPTETIVTETTQPTEEGASTPPPVNENTTDAQDEEGGIGITHAQTAEIRGEFGLPEYAKEPQTFEQWDKEAKQRIENGEMPSLLKKLKDKIPPTEVEQRMMGQYIANLEEIASRTKADKDITKLHDAIKLSDAIGGSSIGRALVARRGIFLPDDSLAGFFVSEMEASQVNILTDEQKAVAEKEYNDLKAANEKYRQDIEALSNANSKLKGEAKIKTVTLKIKPKERKTKEDFKKERDSIVESMRKKLAQARGELNIVPLPYAKELISISPDIARMVKSYVDEGITKLAEIVDNIHEILKDNINGITKDDVQDLIAGVYNPPAKTKTELQIQLQDVKDEAKLINKLQKLQNGEVPKTPKEKKERNQNIQALQNEIKEFNKKQKEADKFYPEDVLPDAKKLISLKNKNDKEAVEIQKQIDEGKFKPPEKNKPFLEDKEVQKNFPELYKKAKSSKDKLIKVKQDREIRLLREEYANRTKWQKRRDFALEILNVPRTIMSSIDFSAPLRQGVVPSISHPKLAAKAFVEMFRQSVSQKRFDRWFFDLRQDPDFTIMEKSGLYVADPHDLKLSAKEEQFMNNLAEKIPLIGKLIKGSERAYVSYLNKMRVDLFKQGEAVLISTGKTLENSPDAYKGLASWVNNSTGRGGLGKAETMAPILNSVFFSPRLIASRLNLLNPIYYAKLPPNVRNMALGDMAKFVTFGLSVLSIAALGADDDDDEGISVETDIRSTDFGKIKIGNTRYDIWGGFQQYVRVIGQIFSGQSKSQSGNIREIDGSGRFGEDRSDLLSRFFRGKLAPVPATVADLFSGRTIMGDKIVYQFGGEKLFEYGELPDNKQITITDEVMKILMPLVLSDVSEAIKNEGVSALFTTWLPATFGVGVQTYENK